MRSRPYSFLAYLLLLGGVALSDSRASAGYAPSQTSLRVGAPTVQLFGAFTPSIGRLSGDATFGYGMSLEWWASERWALGLSATRLAHQGARVTPLSLGVAYGPAGQRALRPWLEAGASYYRFTHTRSPLVRIALASSGNLRDSFGYPVPAPESVSSDAFGAYVGIGAERILTPHLAITVGGRGYYWAGRSGSNGRWDGMVEARSGLSYRF